MGLVLYWRPGTASMAPHAALAEIGVDYRLVEIGRDEAQGEGSYRALNPLGVVPTLVDEEDGLVLTESAAILLYLGDRYPEAQLAPTDRADYYRWLVFLTNTVQTAMLRWFYPERYGGADEVTAAAARDAQEAFDVLERALDGRTWLAADHRTGADLFLFMLTRWARRLEPAAWDRPRLREHFLAALALPGVRRMIEEQGLDLPAWAGVTLESDRPTPA
jgi:glutathione S-transferase